MKYTLQTLLILLTVLLFASCKSFPHGDDDYSLEEVVKNVPEQGIRALVHGADHKRKLYVVSWSHPKNFFNRYNFVISPKNSTVKSTIIKLNRGDMLFLKGNVNMNRGQAHIEVSHLEIKKVYDPKVKYPAGKHERITELPGDLLDKTEEVFYLHATDESGKVLVLEHGDTIVPMIVRNPKLTTKLYRGDYVKLAYKIHDSDDPRRVTHLFLNDKAKEPVKVLDSIVKLHEKEIEYEGRMVMFPKSPTINRNIFAIEAYWPKDKTKAPRYFTLLPKDFTTEKFEAMLKKLQDQWDANPDEIFMGRNKYIHQKLSIKIKGKGNVVSENQANPQIFANIEDLHILGGKKKEVVDQ